MAINFNKYKKLDNEIWTKNQIDYYVNQERVTQVLEENSFEIENAPYVLDCTITLDK